MAAAVPLVDEFVEDLWYDEPAVGAPAGTREDSPATPAPTPPTTRTGTAGPAASAPSAHYL